MKEIRREEKVIIVSMSCPKCEKGELIGTGKLIPKITKKKKELVFEHNCNYCNHTVTLSDGYPKKESVIGSIQKPILVLKFPYTVTEKEKAEQTQAFKSHPIAEEYHLIVNVSDQYNEGGGVEVLGNSHSPRELEEYVKDLNKTSECTFHISK